MLNEPTAADLIQQFDIIELFESHGIKLKKSGREHVCSCPFHDEKTPSCYVNQGNQAFHCKGCGAGGGVVTFFQLYYQIDKGEAFRLMRDRLGLSDGGSIEPAPLRLTEKGKMAAELIANSTIENPYFFSEYGLVTPIHYAYEGQAIIQLSAHGKSVDHLLESELRSGKLTDEGIAAIGQYSQKICVCTDYIDAVYLSQKLDGSILFVFCGHPSRLSWAVDYCKQKYQNPLICAAVPNIYDHLAQTDFINVPHMTPESEGYWCEKNRRQAVK